jgi:tripartite-type tricarboxylate transporter receptor subunit TctC
MRRNIRWLALVAGLTAASAAIAQSYPNRPIRLVVPYAAGQGTDIVARAVGQKLSDRLKQTIVVDNRPGAGGSIGADVVAKAPPDGYTLLMGTNATNAANAALYSSVPFNHLQDFSPVVLVGLLPMVLSAAPEFKAASVREVLEMAKANPSAVNVALPSTSAQIVLELLKQLAGVDLFGVNYKGSGAAFTDVLGGRVPLTIDTVTATLPHIASGKVRPLAITTANRFDAIKSVPTVIESGVAGFDIAPWNAVFAPHGTPREIVSLLNTELVKVLDDAETRQRLVQLGIAPAGGTPEQLESFVQSETRKWGELIRKAKIKAG